MQTSPWAPQAAALQKGFDAAGTALGQAQANQGNAPTNYTAQFDPALIGQFQNMLGYANSNNTQNLQNAGNTAATSGANATQGALSRMLGFDPSAANNPSSLISQANQYVAGQNIPAQVQAAMFDAKQTARDVTMPGIAQGAALSGNASSSRRGIAEGMVERGLAQQSAGLQNSLSGQAFGQGLQLASGNANANNQGSLTAMLGAANAGNSALSAGGGALSDAIKGQGNLFNMGTTAGQGLTDAQQAALTNQQQQYMAGINNPYAALMPYMNLIGMQNWGQNKQGTEESTKNPSMMDSIGKVGEFASKFFMPF